MEEQTMTPKPNTLATFLLLTTAVLLLAHTGSHAQDRIDPRHPSFAYMQEWGSMDGATLTCLPGWVGETGELFGMQIIPTGDLNNDGLAEYIIERTRCDTAFGSDKTTRGNELLLFYGKKNELPTPADGLRIGPTEIGSNSQFIAAGDFDADGYYDIACRYDLIEDTSYGNPDLLYTLSQVVIFWNDRTGHFSLTDTTRLACDGPVWLGGRQAIAADFTNDGITDLLVQTSAKQWNYGTFLPAPRLYLFTGQAGRRWGRSGESRSPVFRWWNPPAFKSMQYRDHDCSGENDLIFYDGNGNIFGNNIIDVFVAYQRLETPWIDTTEIQSINVRSSGSEFALFSDVTGDHVLDLVTIGGDFAGERISVFAGKPGQRLL
ncbi:MAG: VCBS repeat-containing protein, partial [Armatimonadetes bacterium]|nr:VCBS repeat-containing protein [Armatimonadota bacterium]